LYLRTKFFAGKKKPALWRASKVGAGGELILAQALRFPKSLDVLSECHA